jgi:hypothetical protein
MAENDAATIGSGLSQTGSSPGTQPASPIPPSSEPAAGSESTGGQANEESLIGGEQPAKESYVNPDGTFVPDWSKKLPEEMGDFRNKLANYKDTTELAKALHSAHQLIGKKGVIVPGKDSPPEEVAAFRKAMGVPENPADYVKTITPESMPEGIEWSDKLAGPYVDVAHRWNVPPGAMKELVNIRMKETQLQQEAEKLVIQQTQREGIEKLRTIWRGDFTNKLDLVRNAVKYVRGNNNTYGLGDPEVVRIIADLASRMNEDTFVNASASTAGFSSMKARANDIQTNPQNALYKKYWEGDKETQELVRRLRRESEPG